ncbi:MAG TPA: sigma 54-interacting transcriptional regulator [Pyrinomonadaceae bacterium]|jgi:DNA-binding NtrC family response regulator|nr:sigma 54-interacting transcriptional regulator [Pyrinomonadaceae bacterium]
MSLAETLLQQIEDTRLSVQERARLRCQVAGELEHRGQYEAAREALGELWQGVGVRPRLEGFDEETRAEVLLRAGTLSGYLGSANQIEAAQEAAKDLISESITRFESLGRTTRAAAAQSELGVCYWREGALEEARVLMEQSYPSLDERDVELQAKALLRRTLVENSSGRFNDTLRLLTDGAPLFDAIQDHALRGRFHGQMAIAFYQLGKDENRPAYFDRAILEYTAAIFHFEQAGHTRYSASDENNLGNLLLELERYDDAQTHLDRARRLFASLKDKGLAAQVDETRARLLLAKGEPLEAEKTIRSSVHTLEQGGECGLLVEALTTQARVQAALGDVRLSQNTLRRAVDVGEQAGSKQEAGRAALTLLEVHAERLSEPELFDAYQRADELLKQTQDAADLARLRACARAAMNAHASRAAADVGETSALEYVHAEERTASVLRLAKRFAVNKVHMLVCGETGTGKETLARLVHLWSGAEGAFVAVNCAKLRETAAESELFGRRESGGTGAHGERQGAAREAARGTLFLEEVSALSPDNQTRLLHLIEHGEVRPAGSTAAERVEVRVICATSSELMELAADGRFRADLFYRLQAFAVEIPALRERRGDIQPLARHFIARAQARTGRRVGFAQESLDALACMPLKGNGRELRMLVERAMLLAEDGERINADALELLLLRQTGKGSAADPWDGFNLFEEVLAFESLFIQRALKDGRGSVTQASRLLGLKHHESLNVMLKNRHKSLLPSRTPVRQRRRTITKKIKAESNRDGQDR